MALDDLYGKILASSVNVIRKHTILPMLCNHVLMGSDTQSAPMGGIAEVMIPPEFAVRDVVPGSVPPPSDADPAPSTVKVPLDYFKEVNFPLTEKHVQLLENAGREAPMFLENAGAAMADVISTSIAEQYKGIYGFTGVPGVTPFAIAPTDAQTARTTLVKQKCPKSMRHMVIDPDAYGNAIGLAAFRDISQSADSAPITEGEVGRKLGFYWHEEQNLQRHVNPNGTPAGWLVNGAVALGASSVLIDTGANAPVVGDIFTVAGDSQTYAVTSFGAGVMTFAPGAVVAWVDNSAIAFKAAHTVNLAFNPYAFAFASRPAGRLNIPELQQGKVLATWVDDMTGVVLRLEIKDEYHQTGFYLSCLWGVELALPRFAMRIAG